MASSVFLYPGTFTIPGNLVVSGVVNAGNGTAAAPAYSYTSDPTTGQYLIGAANEGFSAGGTLRFDYNATRILSTIPLLFTSDNTVDIGAAGATRPRTGYFGTSVVVPDLHSAGGLDIGTTTANTFTIYTNNSTRIAISSTGLVAYGGLTSSFPAWKRSGATFQARLGDDSAFTSIEALAGTFSSTLTAFGLTPNGSLGTPVTVAGPSGRLTGQTAAVTLATYTVGAADGTFDVSANINVTTSTTHNFTVTCAYTDETNTARTLTLGFTQLSGATFLTAITNVTGAGPYESPVYHIRCKAATTITIATVGGGGFTTVTYNGEGYITQKG